ncbi:GNAT family N-acetyltransferase [bacterium SCSIO 12696]|nr:GNAT family N-acetyltransferase [bacterium SCSIO 12696]
MQLLPATDAHLETLNSWIDSRQQCITWGSENIRYPFTHQSLKEDIQWDTSTNRSLLDAEGGMVGFGQYSKRHNRIHLSRLIISPDHRGKGYGKHLVEQLLANATQALGCTLASLFVYQANQQAIRCYRAIGFTETPCPPGERQTNCPGAEPVIFMTKALVR